MYSEKCKQVMALALKLMEDEAPEYIVDSVTSSNSTKDYFKLRLSGLKNEQFEVLYLDNQHKPLACEVLFKGTIDSSVVYPRVVIQQIIKHNAAAIILAHNNPSGMPEPSAADISITRRLQDACKTIDVKVLDHIIVGGSCYSFSENGLM